MRIFVFKSANSAFHCRDCRIALPLNKRHAMLVTNAVAALANGYGWYGSRAVSEPLLAAYSARMRPMAAGRPTLDEPFYGRC